MNANRTKYSSTPTYGMQKRGFFKKSPLHAETETPDFSQMPETAFPMPGQSGQPVIPPQSVNGMPNGSIPPPMPYQPMQASFQNMPVQQPVMPVMPPVQPFIPTGMQPPLANMQPPVQQQGFSAHGQGFIPPQPPVSQPIVQPASAFIPPMPPMPGFQQENNMTGVMPFAQGTSPTMQMPPVVPPQIQPAPPAKPPKPPRPPRDHSPVDPDKIWAAFIFIVLPLLFIPVLFMHTSLNLLRYAFIILCVVGLGGMWYRQMFNSTTRLITSMVYVALCIVTIALTMQGGRNMLPSNVPASNQRPNVSQSDQAPSSYSEPPVSQPTPSPTVSGPSQAEKRLDQFMSLWQNNNTAEMVSLVQPSWAREQDNPSKALFVILSNRTPLEYTIEDISGTEKDSSRTVTMSALISKNNGKEPNLYRFMVIMVNEGNEWYVDPFSLATATDQKKEGDENVVNDKSVAAATQTPRTTVTPPPPADTLLYYNDGGNYFHKDQYCPSVKDEFLPLQHSFTYGELKTYMSEPYGLLPCLRCGAPTSTLPDSPQ